MKSQENSLIRALRMTAVHFRKRAAAERGLSSSFEAASRAYYYENIALECERDLLQEKARMVASEEASS